MRAIAFIGVVVLAACQRPPEPTAVRAGFPLAREERVLAADATDRFSIALQRGESAAIVVTQQGVDVVVETSAPDGQVLAMVDSPNGREGDEPVEIVATQDGTYQVAVRSLERGAGGRYTIAVTAKRDVAETRALLAERVRMRNEATAWLRARSGAVSLRGADVTGDGLARFDALWSYARTVGLGEATHGSRQFGDMRLALTRRAIERHGVRVIGLEASSARMRLVDRWARDGVGEVAPLFGPGWINRRAFVALADEVRRWNVAHPADPVTLVGLDDQDNAPARAIVAGAARALEAADARRLEAVLARVADADAQAAVFGRSDVLVDDWRFLAALVERVPPDAADAARTLAQFAELNSGADDARRRDWLMAENLLRAADGRRAVLWAHNAHVGHPPERRGARATTGGHLSDHGGYAALAFAFRAGSFLAQRSNDPEARLDTFELPPADADSIDAVLAPLGVAVATWLRDPAVATAPAWLAEARPMHWVGALYTNERVPGQGYQASRLLLDYDGVVMFDRVDAELPP